MSPSDSPVAGGPDPFFRRRPGKEPERSNFSQTCNLLSQYFKQRGAPGVTDNKAICDSYMAAPTAAIDLSPNTPKSTQAAPGTRMNLLPNRGKSDGTPGLKGPVGKAEFRKPAERGPATAQMTIFYAGKVVVYNDFSADKARDIMGEAERHASSYCVSRTTEVAKIKFSSSAIVSDSNVVSVPEMKRPATMGQHRPNGSHLPIPIATRSSLHRFFSKRKDRAAAKVPYQVNGRENAHPPEEGQNSNRSPDLEILGSQSPKESALEVEMLEGQSSKQCIDLNL